MSADVFSKSKRSEVMSRIRGRGNRDTELRMIKIFRANRITGWRRNQKVFGNPDFTFPKLKLAVFVDGCFWHSCPIHATKPTHNCAFWEQKLGNNKKRDLVVSSTLYDQGWVVIRLWEHELRRNNTDKLLKKLEMLL